MGGLESESILASVPLVERHKVLDPCVLYGKLGEGAMGAVYRGRHLNLEIDVAVKCLKAAAVGHDPGSIARFQREATTAARIHGAPNLVHVYDVKSAFSLHYIVMEYIDGETVEDRVRRKGPLSVDEACAITLAATEGLAAAHAASVIHRDIKPPNIMVSRRGHVKLTDLGIAKSTTVEETLVTMPTALMGTPQYMPPEQFEGAAQVDARSDVYAMGATLFYMLAGRHPFDARSVREVMKQVCVDGFPDVTAISDDLPDSIVQVLRRATASDREDRYEGAAALAADVRGCFDAGGPEVSLADDDAGAGATDSDVVTPPSRAQLTAIRTALVTPQPSLIPATIAGPGRAVESAVPRTIAQPGPAPAGPQRQGLDLRGLPTVDRKKLPWWAPAAVAAVVLVVLGGGALAVGVWQGWFSADPDPDSQVAVNDSTAQAPPSEEPTAIDDADPEDVRADDQVASEDTAAPTLPATEPTVVETHQREETVDASDPPSTDVDPPDVNDAPAEEEPPPHPDPTPPPPPKPTLDTVRQAADAGDWSAVFNLLADREDWGLGRREFGRVSREMVQRYRAQLTVDGRKDPPVPPLPVEEELALARMAEAGCGAAWLLLGESLIRYSNSDAVESDDRDTARTWLEEAVSAGETHACFYLGDISSMQLDDAKGALKMYQRGHLANDPDCTARLGLLHYMKPRQFPELSNEQRLSKAEYLFDRAVTAGSVRGMYWYGYYLYNETSQKAAGVELLERAAATGFPLAIRNLSVVPDELRRQSP